MASMIPKVSSSIFALLPACIASKTSNKDLQPATSEVRRLIEHGRVTELWANFLPSKFADGGYLCPLGAKKAARTINSISLVVLL